jgi:hypothetical protein
MGNPNPFYRFETGWNSGFYPDNQIVSDLLNEVYSAINTALPTIAVVGTTTYGQLKASVKGIVDGFNVSPYFGNFTVTANLTFVNPTYAYIFTIKDEGLFATDVSQEFTVAGTTDSSKVLNLAAILSSFAPGSYSGTFDDPLIDTEKKVQEALNVVDMNGSAFFPITYKFDPTTNIATSGLARGKNWKLDNGSIERFPPPQNPYQNQRTFQLPELNGDDLYVISLIERVIQDFLTPQVLDPVALTIELSSLLPQTYTLTYTYPSYTVYERIQINFIDSGRRTFILVGRKIGGTWLWQRFVSDVYINPPFDFLSTYSETTALPYEPNQAGRWLYNDDTFDFEFVEFTSGCFESKEFYPMPAKPGDQFQFNVVDGNLTFIDQANVGLFSESGDFIQKIGEAIVQTVTFSLTGFYWQLSGNNLGYAQWWSDVYDETGFNQGEIRFYLVSCTGELIGSPLGIIPAGTLTNNNPGLFVDAFNAINWPASVKNAIVTIIGSTVEFTFDLSSQAECNCGIQMQMLKQVVGGTEEFLFIDPSDLTSSNPSLYQHQATVTIPSKEGCYRMGLYNLSTSGEIPVNACEVTYNKIFSASDTDDFLAAVFNLYGTLTPYVAFSLNNQTYTYLVPDVATYDLIGADLAAWANSTIPGMVCTWDSDFLIIGFEWTIELPCETEAVFQVCSAADEGGVCINVDYPFFITESACCPCEDKCQATFENDVPISGCSWLADLEDYPTDYFGFFLTDSESFPYENKTCLYKISVADLVSGEYANDFCAFWANFTNWLGGIPEMSYTLTWPDEDECISEQACDYEFSFLFTPYIPCNTNYKFTMGYLDENDNLLELKFNFDPVSCECPPPPPPTGDQFALYSLSNIINIDKSDCFSTILEFWADSNSVAQGMQYFNDWKQRVRIGLNGGGEKPVFEESLYRQSNGVHRRPQNKQDLSLDLHTDFFDLDTQLAMTDATRHPYLIYEGKSIFVKGDVEVATIQDFTTQSSFETLSQMKFQALIQGFQPRNSSCLTC